MPDPLNPFSTNLRRLRRRRGLTQEQLGDRAGMTQSYISRLERGVVSPNIRMAVRLASALDVDMSELLPREPAS